MTSKFTRPGSLRQGFEYQDLWGAQILIDFIEHRDRYRWIRFEADDAYSLDDITALRSDGSFIYRQIKFTVDDIGNRYPADWNWLLNDENGKKKSLLKKWFDSYKLLKTDNPIHEASLITNRIPDEYLNNSLNCGRINFRDLEDDRRNEIIAKLGDEYEVKNFFENFKFQFDSSDPYSLKQTTYQRFSNIGGTTEGWYSLKEKIRKWATQKDEPRDGGQIYINDILIAALWRRLEYLPQNFVVPEDYILPDENFHNDLLEKITQGNEDCFIIVGNPGVGKSTYLSFLANKFKKDNISVLRHHYYLSMVDASGDRYDHLKVASSLMQQLSDNYPEEIGHYSNENPDPNNFRKWLEAAANYSIETNKKFIVIIDGLDHVFRERNSIDELNYIFEYLLPVPKGICLCIGTQPVSDDLLPNRLLTHFPREKWLSLPQLSQNSLLQWIQYHKDYIDIPPFGDESYYLSLIAGAFYQLTQGHPLHLRYSFEFLAQKGAPFGVEDVELLPPCADGKIINYYDSLYRNLSESGKQMLHLLAIANFSWPPEGLIQCLSIGGLQDAEVRKAHKTITHLLREDLEGFKIFHQSLATFILEHSDNNSFEKGLLPRMAEWLSSHAPEALRWAHEWLVRARLGETKLLIESPTHSWVVESIAKGRSIDQLLSILHEAAWLSLKENQLSRVIELMTWATYASNSKEFQTDGFEDLLYVQIRLFNHEGLWFKSNRDFSKFNDKELINIAEYASAEKLTDIAENCLLEYERRLNLDDHFRENKIRNDHGLKCYIDIVASWGFAKPEKVIKYIRDYDDSRNEDLFGIYCRRIVSIANVDAIRGFFKLDLDQYEKNTLYLNSLRIASKEQIDIKQWWSRNIDIKSGLINAFVCLNLNHFNIQEIWFPSHGIFKIKDYELYQYRNAITKWYHDLFFSSFALRVFAEGDYSNLWLQKLPEENWGASVAILLSDTAVLLADTALEKNSISQLDFYNALESLTLPDNSNLREQYTFLHSFRDAVVEIAFDIEVLMSAHEKRDIKIIGLDEIKVLFNNKHWDIERWLKKYLEFNKKIMSIEAATWLLVSEEDLIKNKIEQLNDRYYQYALLAKFASSFVPEFRANCLNLLKAAATCAIGYGWRKDFRLNECISIISICNEFNVGDTKKWISQIAPMIAAINEITDGDETSYFKIYLAESILKAWEERFPAYYFELFEKQEWYSSESIIERLVTEGNISDPIIHSIILTVLHDKGLSALQQRAEKGDALAQKVFEMQEEYFGGIFWDEFQANDVEKKSIKGEEDFPNPALYPPEAIKKYIKFLKDNRIIYDDKALRNWFEYWLTSDEIDQIIKNIESLLSNSKYEYKFERLFFRIFEVVLSFKGKQEAFPWLVRSHNARNGWSSNWTNKEEAIDLFNKVRKLYPERWLEFIKLTAKSKYNTGPVLGLSRLVHFCLIVDRPDIAVEIAETIINTTVELQTDLRLENPKWMQTPEAYLPSWLTLLFSRMEWPSLKVRERTAGIIYNLLSGNVPNVRNAYLQWIKKRPVESLCANALMVPFRLKNQKIEINYKSEDVHKAIKYPSILSDQIFHEMGILSDRTRDLTNWHSGDAPSNFVPDEYFEKYKRSFVPPIYDINSERIGKKLNVPFGIQWAYEWEHICEERNISKSGPPQYFIRTRDSDELVHFDVLQSEVFRSAFLRTLAWAVDKNRMPMNHAIFFAYQSCPLDIGIWKVPSKMKPSWWEKIDIPKSEIDTVAGDIWKVIDKLWDAKEKICSEKVLAHVQGLICFSEKNIYDLEIFSAFQKFEGGDEPKLEEPFDWLKSNFIAITKNLSLNLEEQILEVRPDGYISDFGGWSLAPVVSGLRSCVTLRWQPERFWRGIWIPNPQTFHGINTIKCDSDSIKLINNGREISHFEFWNDGLREKWYPDVPPPTGTSLYINTKDIRNFCEYNSVNFIWIAKITNYYRKDSFERFKSNSLYKAVGSSRIIIGS